MKHHYVKHACQIRQCDHENYLREYKTMKRILNQKFERKILTKNVPSRLTESTERIMSSIEIYHNVYEIVLTHKDFDTCPNMRTLITYNSSIGVSNAQNERCVLLKKMNMST